MYGSYLQADNSYLGSLAADALGDDAVASQPTVAQPQQELLVAEPQITLPGGITIPRKTAIAILVVVLAVAAAWYLKKKR